MDRFDLKAQAAILEALLLAFPQMRSLDDLREAVALPDEIFEFNFAYLRDHHALRERIVELQPGKRDGPEEWRVRITGQGIDILRLRGE